MICNVAAASMDPFLFPDPTLFIPARWEALEKDKKSKVQAHTCASNFSHGPRICPGHRLARAELTITLSRLLQDYKLSVVSEYVTPKTNSSIVNVPTPSPNLKWESRSK